MKAKIGDRIVVGGNRAGQAGRHCVVLEVRGANGEPPYVVRWSESEREDLYFPGSDASVVSDENA
jgi:hypothetical protein